jgi:glycosyltransferase involved in cell wall biosynthesis
MKVLSKNASVDVAVANYNNGRYLEELIESLLNQSNPNWNLIIVDDASTDNSVEIVTKFLNDKRISFISSSTNLGATATFKKAIEYGTNPYVALLGADDTLPSNAIDRLLFHFENHPSISTFYSKANQCDSAMNYVQPWPLTKPLNPELEIFDQINSIFNLIAFRRVAYNATPGLNPSLRRAMDHDLIYKLEEVGNIGFIQEPLYNYRVHTGGISQGSKNGQIAFQYAILAKLDALQRRRIPFNRVSGFKDLKSLFHLRSLEHCYSYSGSSWLHHLFLCIINNPTNFSAAIKAYLRLVFKKPSIVNEIHISNLEKS